jgi:branched-subunit amino acid ABC-type transport system permease component
VQILIDGAIGGLSIALLALAFTAVYLPTHIFHVALGGIYVAVPLVAWACLQKQWPWPLAAAMAISVGTGLSLACDLANHAWLERRSASSGAHLVASLGIYILLSQGSALAWGSETKVLRTGLDTVWHLGAIVITRVQMITAAVSTLLLMAFFGWLHFSDLGLQFRALSSNPAEAAIRGLSLRQLHLIAFALSGFLAAVSALTVSLELGLSPQGGLAALLLAVVAAIIGGRETFVGPILGGLLLGILRAQAVWHFSARWQDAVTFVLLAAFIFLRPSGLLSRTQRLEASR